MLKDDSSIIIESFYFFKKMKTTGAIFSKMSYAYPFKRFNL